MNLRTDDNPKNGLFNKIIPTRDEEGNILTFE